MTMRNNDNDTVGIRRKSTAWRFMGGVCDVLRGRVGMKVCLFGRREVLYPCMSRKRVRFVADEICASVSEENETK